MKIKRIINSKFIYTFFCAFGHVGRPALTVNKAMSERDRNINGALMCVYLTDLTFHSYSNKPCEKRKNEQTTS